MKEYTVAGLVAVLLIVAIDRLLRTHVMKRFEFWIFIVVMFGFKLVFNGYLTWRPIVIYAQDFFLGIRLGTIPLEDFAFGFSMMALSVILWEHARKRRY
jgi:lycopene cyclase domain-containing protein